MAKRTVRKPNKTVKRNQARKIAAPTKRPSPLHKRAESRSPKAKNAKIITSSRSSVKRNQRSKSRQFTLPPLPTISSKSSTTARGSDKNTKKESSVKRNDFIAPLECEKETHYSIMNLDGNLMAGVLHEPARPSKTLVIVIHGFMADKNETTVRQVSISLSRAGYATYRMDLSGNGDSEGRFEDATPAKQVRDVVAVAENFRKRFSKIILLGVSFGGTIAVIAAARLKVDGVIAVAAPMRLGELADKLLSSQQVKELLSVGFTTMPKRGSIGEIPYVITERFVSEMRSSNPLDEAKNVYCPVLVVHGTNDTYVPASHSQDLFEMSHLKDILLIGGANHAFTNPQHLDALIAGIIDWLRKLK